ncbi:MAG: ATP-binding protein [Campylobacterota bacterium]
MKLFLLLYSLLLSSTLFAAQQTLQEARVEENLFILKIIGVVILILIIMPIILRQLRALAPKPERHKPLPAEQETKPKKKIKPEAPEEDEEEVQRDPLDVALENLFNERMIPQEKRESFTPLYRQYLELKMGKVDIKTGSFDFNTALDAVMTKVHTLASDRNFEIVFDIDANVPSQLIGDAERMEDTLFYLIQNVVFKSRSYLIEIKVKRLNLGDGALHLEFYISYDKDNFEEEKLDIFTPFLEGKTQTGLELYLAKEYARLMHGDVTFEPENENDSAFMVTLKLYMPNPNEMRHYRLPSKTMTGHSVLIVDDHNASALAIQKMFEYFKNEVDVLSSKELFSALEMLEDYDILVIQERYFAKHLNAKLEAIKSKRAVKAVSLNKNESFEHSDAETIALLDGELSKPVTVQKVFDLLVSLYQEKKEV